MDKLDLSGLEKKIDWDKFVERMESEDYALVIGPEVILADNCDLRDWEDDILSQIKSKSKSYTLHDAYRAGRIPIRSDHVDSLVRKLLATRCFKIVITPIIHPFLEKVFDDVWGRDKSGIPNYDIYSFAARDSKNSDILNIESFISSGDHRPALIYLLGNISDCDSERESADGSTSEYQKWRLNRQSNEIAQTERDFMKAISYWLQPKKIHTLLESRKLLVLGGKYDDWAFRFLLYALKGFDYKQKDEIETHSEISIPIRMDHPSDVSLKTYLEESNMYVGDSEIKDFIGEILNHYKRHREEVRQKRLESDSKQMYDAFISYASEDAGIANRLYRHLCNRGLKVWLDYPLDEKANIDQYKKYKPVIEEAIEKSVTFIPLLSGNTKSALEMDSLISEKEKHRFFHNIEWRRAVELHKPIYPVAAGILSRTELGKVGCNAACEIFWPDEKNRLDNEVNIGLLCDGVEMLCKKIEEEKNIQKRPI